VTGNHSWLFRTDLWLVTKGADSLDLKAGPDRAGGAWLNKPGGSVMMRITPGILDLGKLGETVPPRDPDNDDESEDEEDDEGNEDLEPAVIREPDE
jgi:hypothetical protein